MRHTPIISYFARFCNYATKKRHKLYTAVKFRSKITTKTAETLHRRKVSVASLPASSIIT
ncbi:hypothetical protein CYJ59_02090 [Gardnerella leopoldii]|uniref:Uncharacterized protein n=2 Tax=Gardnerella TaxID=2701 RepID=A0AAP8ISW0_GARVA|nr:hypothetical protein CYJ60_02090 [Gardnerella vaginalis]PKZ19257.1 hypothetical protein CYJ59_02090 [Gardnerella vaginalis]PKZ59729.1 hypothetical protein CYJ61_05480 [Gardnerella vaginalis]